MSEEREALRRALKRVAVVLKQAEVPFALAGGYAAWARGAAEPEHDADFVVPVDDTERAATALAEAGLEVSRPADEDWLFKVRDGGAVVDVVHALSGRPLDRADLDGVEELAVLSVRMPVLSATDVLVAKLLALSEHACDFTKLLPTARSLREQVRWPAVRDAVDGRPFARAFLSLAVDLGIAPPA